MRYARNSLGGPLLFSWLPFHICESISPVPFKGFIELNFDGRLASSLVAVQNNIFHSVGLALLACRWLRRPQCVFELWLVLGRMYQ